MHLSRTTCALLLAVVVTAARGAEADQLLPDNTQGILHIEVRQLVHAPLVQQHGQTLLRPWFLEQTGLHALTQVFPIDAARDLDRLTLAGPLPLREGQGLLIARGRFDEQRMRTAAEQHAAKAGEALKIHKAGDHVVYQLPPPSKAYVCFLDEHTLVMAPSRQSIAEALARQRNARPPHLSKDLQTLIASIDGQPTLWLAALATPELKKELSTSAETEKWFANVQHFRGGLTIDAGLQADFRLQTADKATAGEMRKFLEGVKAILSLAALDHPTHGPPLSEFVKALRVIQVQEAVVLQARLTAQQLERVRPMQR